LGQRQTLLPTLEYAWPCLFLLEENEIFANNTLVRKMLVKLAQRFGMCYLKPKIASWRYQRGYIRSNVYFIIMVFWNNIRLIILLGNRSLKDNLKESSGATTTGIDSLNVNQSLKESEEEEEEIPSQIEEIIEILLNGLRNKVNIVLLFVYFKA
jgi:tubulin-specific chaperone D